MPENPEWVVGDGPTYQARMKQIIAKSPWKWTQCPKCQNWAIKANPKDKHCSLCPPEPKNAAPGRQEEEVYDPVTKQYVPKQLW